MIKINLVYYVIDFLIKLFRIIEQFIASSKNKQVLNTSDDTDVNDNTDNQLIMKMMNDLKSAPKIYSVSKYWIEINKSHIKEIQNLGLSNFKRSINIAYFNWGVTGLIMQHLHMVLIQIIKGNLKPLVASRYVEKKIKSNSINIEPLSKLFYRIFIAYLYDYVRKVDHRNLLVKISEPKFGNPFLIMYRNNLISQDLCNSMHEFYSITDNLELKSKFNVAELGAGYGRLAYVFLKALPESKYCIIDIPPALYISQEYFKKVFPDKKLFLFRSFHNFKEIEKEFNESQIRFILPHQVRYIPRGFFDLFINISSLHEMRRDQIDNYLKQANRVTKGYIYTKQWRKSFAKDNNFIREQDYPIPKDWKIVYQRRHPIQNMFFEALYRVKN